MGLQEIRETVISGKRKEIPGLVNAELANGTTADVILRDALMDAMSEIGRRFEKGKIYVPEMLVAAKAMQTGVETLKPYLVEGSTEASGEVVIGTIKGDLHDIGKNLVKMMLEGAGFKVIDLGVDVAPSRFVSAIGERTRIVAMSALLTTTMVQMKTAVDLIREAGLRDKVKVIVGGAPVTPAYANQIGADGYSPDAASAVRKAKELAGA